MNSDRTSFTHRKWVRWTGAILLLLGVGVLGYWWGHHGSGGSSGKSSSGDQGQPTAQVKLARIEHKRITESAIAYGTVIARPGKADTISVPFESLVRHVLVAAGESVVKGTKLVTIAPSPATRLQVEQAHAAYEAAQRELQQTKERFNLKFATNQDLSKAESAAETARLKWQNMADIPKENAVIADEAAVVGNVAAHDGQIVPAGQPLVELVDRSQIEVKLEVEPEDATFLKPGDAVKLAPIHAREAPTFSGRVRLITERVSPDTHLVEIYVAPPPGTNLLLGASLRAELATASDVGLVVPRAAVLPANQGDVLFTVDNGHAVQHRVRPTLQTEQEVEVDGFGLNPGDPVVVEGNHELSDGMPVKVNAQP